MFGNATLQWAQYKFSKTPRVVRVEDREKEDMIVKDEAWGLRLFGRGHKVLR